MFASFLIVTVAAIAVNAGMAFADLSRAQFVLNNSRQVGVPQSWLPVLAALKAAGAAGLVAGVVGVAADIDALRYLGIAAGVGLVLFFAGALATHVRARVFYNVYFPGTYWLLAVASLVLVSVQ